MACGHWDVHDELILINARKDGVGWDEMGHLFTDKRDRTPWPYWRHYKSLWDRYKNGCLDSGPVLDALSRVDPNTGEACPDPGPEPRRLRSRRTPLEGAIGRAADASGQDNGGLAFSALRERAPQPLSADDTYALSRPSGTSGPSQGPETNQVQDFKHDSASLAPHASQRARPNNTPSSKFWPPEDDLILVTARHRETQWDALGSLFNVKRNMTVRTYQDRYRLLRTKYWNGVLTAGPVYDEMVRYLGPIPEAKPSRSKDEEGDIPSSTAGIGGSSRDQSEQASSPAAAATDQPAAENDPNLATAVTGATQPFNSDYSFGTATSPTTNINDKPEGVDSPGESSTNGSEQPTPAPPAPLSHKSAPYRDSVLFPQRTHPNPTEMASPAPAPGINGTSTPPNLRGTPPTTQTSATLDNSNAPAAAAGAGPAISTTDDGMSKRPKDYRLMHTVLAAHGVQAYEERVPLMLLDFAYRYTRGVLNDALALSADGYGAASGSGSNARGGAGGAGAAGAAAAAAGAPGEGTVTLPQLRVAVASRQDHQFAEPLPKNHMLELAQEVNRVALPKPDRRFGLRLPPEQYCFTGVGFGLTEEWEDDVQPAGGPSGDGEVRAGAGAGAGADRGDETMRDEEEGAEEEDEFEEVMGVGQDKEMVDA